MGLILDSSVVIAAERRGHTIRQILEQIRYTQGEVDVALSVITIAELMHGAYRAKADADKRRRLAFVDRLCSDVPVHPVTIEIARRIGTSRANKQLSESRSRSKTWQSGSRRFTSVSM